MEITEYLMSNGSLVVSLEGRLDLMSAAEFKRYISEAVIRGHKRVVVDLCQVKFIDSSGLGALISGLKVARSAGGDLRIARPSDQAKLILQLTTLESILRPFSTVEEAFAKV